MKLKKLKDVSLRMIQFQILIKTVRKESKYFSRGGDQVVNLLAFYSDDPSLNRTYTYSYFCKICV